MTIKWIKIENTKGVRYYEHSTRMYKNRKDRSFALVYKLDGKTKSETLGWESDGWTARKAAALLQELKQNQSNGISPRTLAEKRQFMRHSSHENEKRPKKKESLTFSEIFEKYIAQAIYDKSVRSRKNEISFCRNWLKPIIGDLTMQEITPDILNSIKNTMLEKGRTPGTTSHVLIVARQVFNFARSHDLYFGDNPVSKIKKPSRDNRRLRFLTKKEAGVLFEYLGKASQQTHDIALLSLHCGLRAGEIFNLSWNDVDFENGILSIKDAKNGKSRSAIMTGDVRKMLEENRKDSASNNLIFTSMTGKKIKEVPRCFAEVVKMLGFNNGIDDNRQKVVFHTLRHTFASWLIMSGVDLYTVQKLMGHSTISMTERYSHLAPDHLKKAIATFEASLDK